MPRVDFYLLDDAAPRGVALLACRLTEKAFMMGHRIYLRTGSAEQTQELDDLLWTFKQNAFLPHQPYSSDQILQVPILLGHAEEPADAGEVLINLNASLPTRYAQYARVAEVVGPDDTQRKLARERFRVYREQGCEMNTHHITGNAAP